MVKEWEDCAEAPELQPDQPAPAWRLVAAVDPTRRSPDFERYCARFAAAVSGETLFLSVRESAPEPAARPFEWLQADEGDVLGPNHIVLRGAPVPVMLRRAQFAGAAVLLMNCHDRTGWSRIWHRSVSAQVLRQARMAVQLVPADRPPARGGEVRNVLCLLSLDATDPSTLDFAIFVAQRSGARITFLYVLPEISEGTLAMGSPDQDVPLMEPVARKRLEELVQHVPVEHEIRIARGNVMAAVAREARRIEADLAVVARAFGPGVYHSQPCARTILDRIHCPVVSVPFNSRVSREAPGGSSTD
jgi:nucleotide-binding universal stress UspA family protein